MKTSSKLKRMAMALVVALAVVAIIIVGCAKPAPAPAPAPAPTPAQEVYHWRWPTLLPPSIMESNCGPFRDAVYEMSDGQIQIELYAESEIIPFEEQLSSVGKGIVEGGEYCGFAGTIPDIGPMTCLLPFGWTSAAEAYALYDERGILDIMREAYAEEGVYYISHKSGDPAELVSSRPIRSYEDLQGLKVMTFGIIGKMLAKAGCSVTTLPIEETYLAAQTGLVEGTVWGGARDAKQLGFDEVMPYLLAVPLTNFECGFIINLDLWNSLPSNLQAILYHANRSCSLTCAMDYYNAEAVYRKNFTVTELPPEELAKLKEAAYKVWDEQAQISPRAAKVISIIREFNEDVEAAKWFRQ